MTTPTSSASETIWEIIWQHLIKKDISSPTMILLLIVNAFHCHPKLQAPRCSPTTSTRVSWAVLTDSVAFQFIKYLTRFAIHALKGYWLFRSNCILISLGNVKWKLCIWICYITFIISYNTVFNNDKLGINSCALSAVMNSWVGCKKFEFSSTLQS